MGVKNEVKIFVYWLYMKNYTLRNFYIYIYSQMKYNPRVIEIFKKKILYIYKLNINMKCK